MGLTAEKKRLIIRRVIFAVLLIFCAVIQNTPGLLPEPFGARPEHRRLDDLLGTYSLKQAKVIMERRLIQRAMEHTGGNKTKAAQLLELSYPALLGKLKEYGC